LKTQVFESQILVFDKNIKVMTVYSMTMIQNVKNIILIFYFFLFFTASYGQKTSSYKPRLFVDTPVLIKIKDSAFFLGKYRDALGKTILSMSKDLGYQMTERKDEANIIVRFRMEYTNEGKLHKNLYFSDKLLGDTITRFGTIQEDSTRMFLRNSIYELPLDRSTYQQEVEFFTTVILTGILAPFDTTLNMNLQEIERKGYRTLQTISINSYVETEGFEDKNLVDKTTNYLCNSVISYAFAKDKYWKKPEKEKNKFMLYRDYLTPRDKPKRDVIISCKMSKTTSENYQLELLYEGADIVLDSPISDEKLETRFIFDKERVDKGDYTELIYKMCKLISGFCIYNYNSLWR
jgi:hypothetical protein